MKIVRAIILIVNAVAAAGLVLTTLAGAVAPSKGILLSLASFAFVPMLLVNVAFVVLWLLMGRWEFLLSTAAIAARFAFVGLYFQIGGAKDFPPADEHPAMVTFMSYNVHQFHGQTEAPGTAGDSNALAFLALVKEHAPDVLCLQEYAAVRGLDVTDSLAVMGYNHYYGTRGTAAGVPYGSVVFSRKPITYVRRLDAEKLMAELECDDGRKLRVICLHMDSYRFDTTDRRGFERMAHGNLEPGDRTTLSKVKETIVCHEKEWTAQVAPALAESETPVVVAGDLNDIPSSWLYHQMTRTLTDTYREKGLGFSTTFCGEGMPSYRIDVIMHGKGLRTLSHRRLKVPISDHYPVMAAIEFEK